MLEPTARIRTASMGRTTRQGTCLSGTTPSFRLVARAAWGLLAQRRPSACPVVPIRGDDPSVEDNTFGFRVASVPETSAGLLTMLSASALSHQKTSFSPLTFCSLPFFFHKEGGHSCPPSQCEAQEKREALQILRTSIGSATGMSRLLISAAGGRNFFLQNETTRSRSPRRAGEMV